MNRRSETPRPATSSGRSTLPVVMSEGNKNRISVDRAVEIGVVNNAKLLWRIKSGPSSKRPTPTRSSRSERERRRRRGAVPRRRDAVVVVPRPRADRSPSTRHKPRRVGSQRGRAGRRQGRRNVSRGTTTECHRSAKRRDGTRRLRRSHAGDQLVASLQLCRSGHEPRGGVLQVVRDVPSARFGVLEVASKSALV